MRQPEISKPAARRKRTMSTLIRLRKDQTGTTAIEFGMLAMPFLMFMMSIAGYGHYWLTNSQLNFAVSTAARQIRTGEAQRQAKTVDDFKQAVCDNLTVMVECNSNLQIHVQNFEQWAEVLPLSCIDASGSGLRGTAGNGSDPLTATAGEASRVVLVTACYKWELAQNMPWLLLGAKDKATNVPQLDGAALIQATTIFRTEPYQ